MGLNKTVLIMFGGVVALVLAYYLYTPLPDWAGEPWRLRSYIVLFKLAKLAGIVVSSVTSLTNVEVLRSITEVAYLDSYAQTDPLVEVIDTSFDGVPVKIFHPKAARSSSPAIIYFHGGGFTLFSVNTYSRFTDFLARASNMIVVSVDYQLAPENPFPFPFQDCLKAAVYFLQNAEKYGVNPQRVAIAGDSAGGNLAAAVALRLSHEDRPDIPRFKSQILLYPCLQALNFDTYSYRTYANTGFLTKDLMIFFWLNYLGIESQGNEAVLFSANNHTSRLLKISEYASFVSHQNLPESFRSKDFKPLKPTDGNITLFNKIEPTLIDPHFSPLMAGDLSKSPPAYIVIAENDPVRDDGLLYAERLKKSNVSVILKHFSTMAHGFLFFPPFDTLTFQLGLEALDDIAKYVKLIV